MISLLNLLLENDNSPKAIFLAGPAGSGKSYIINKLQINDFKIINVDDTYENLLNKSGLGTKQIDFDSDQLSQAAKLMAVAQKITRQKYTDTITSKNNIIIDGTGAASRPILEKKKQLEDLGYKTFMVFVWVSPITSLERNRTRDRSLMPSIILRTWRDVNSNIELYREEFGNNIVIINNDQSRNTNNFDLDFVKKTYFDTAKAKGKPKSPEEIEKSKATTDKINSDISQLLKSKTVFDTDKSVKLKLKSFLN